MNTDALFRRIDKFLQERKKIGRESRAVVTDEEIDQLHKIINRILNLKYQRSDGELPIEWKLINRNKYQWFGFHPVPYYYTPDRKMWARIVATNLDLATRDIKSFTWEIENGKEEVQKED